jgi:ankyrin repeat protein
VSGPPDEEMARWLLDNGADPNCACNLDLTPMSFAIKKAPLHMINMLFEKGAEVHRGQMLHYAVLRETDDALQVVTKLVEAGAPVDEVMYENQKDSFRKQKDFGLGTPLHRAAEHNRKDIVEYLLSKGANPLKLDTKRRTPRFWAEKGKHWDVAMILRAAEGI